MVTDSSHSHLCIYYSLLDGFHALACLFMGVWVMNEFCSDRKSKVVEFQLLLQLTVVNSI